MKAYVLNEIGSKQDGILSNAIDDYFIRNINDNEIILHLFQHPGVNMGSDDFHHKNLKRGVDYLGEKGYPVYLRQSGGRAVVSDVGVLNMALIFKSNKSSEENYLFYTKFIQDALESISNNIVAGQIDGAYCPGDFDLSIQGRKISGTAQKRIGENVEMDSYLTVHGSQDTRVELIQGFYEAIGINPFPIVNEKMANLQDFSSNEIDVDDVAQMFIAELKKRYQEVNFLKKEDLDSAKLKKSIEWTQKRHQKLI